MEGLPALSVWHTAERLKGTLTSLGVLPCTPKYSDCPAFTPLVF